MCLKLNFYCISIIIIVIGHSKGEDRNNNISESFFFDGMFTFSLTRPIPHIDIHNVHPTVSSRERCFAFCEEHTSSTICPPMNFFDVIDNHRCDYSSFHLSSSKAICVPIKRKYEVEPQVQILNISQLLFHINSKHGKSRHCVVVLYYARWCYFSALIAANYNALARAFPDLDVVAIEAYSFSNFNSKFGIYSVPTVMLYQSGKSFSRFTNSNRSLASLVAYLSNNTGLEPNMSVTVESRDMLGPVSSVLVRANYYEWLGWAFVLLVALIKLFSTNRGTAVLNSFIDLVNQRPRQLHID